MNNLYATLGFAVLIIGVALLGAYGFVSEDFAGTMVIALPALWVAATGRKGCRWPSKAAKA